MIVLAVMVGEWILLVAGTRRDEMIAGALCIVPAGLFLYVAWASSTLRIQLKWRDMLTGWRLPAEVIRDQVTITLVLLADILHLKPISARFRAAPFHCSDHCSEDTPEATGHRVIATAYATTTPNTIVIGIDENQNQMLLHEMRPGQVSTVARILGVGR